MSARFPEVKLKVTTEQAPDSQVVLTVEVDAERVEQALDQAYRRVVRQVNIPGFRRGKAPRYIVERHVGRDQLFREALKPLLEEIYRETVQGQELQPISAPQAEMIEVDPLTFRFTFSVRPQIELGEYRALRFPLQPAPVTEAEVDAALERVRRDHVTWETVERPARIGDQLLLDVAGGVPDGVQVRRENEEVWLTDPTEGLILGPGVIEQLVGVRPGETRTITITYPQDWADAGLAGQTATYHFTIHAIKEPQLPPLDDDLAAAVGEFESLAALRDHVRQLMQVNAEAQAWNGVRDQMITALVSGATVDTPAVLIEAEIDELLEELQQRLRRQGLTLERYLALSNTTLEGLRTQMRDSARERVRQALVLGEFARREGLDVTEAEVEAEIERLAAGDQVRTTWKAPEQRQRIANQLLAWRIGERLVAIATGMADSSPATDTPTQEETRS